jgi:hypothetical protein
MLLQQKAVLHLKHLGFDYSFPKEMGINMMCLFTNKHQIEGVCDEEGAEEDILTTEMENVKEKKTFKNPLSTSK